MRIPAVTAAALALLAGAAQAAEPGATAKRLEADYVITWLGFPVYSGRFAIAWNGERYRMRFQAEALGIARLANSTTIDWETTGRLAKGKVRPERFAQANTFRRKTRRITLAYAAKGPPSVSVVPPESPGKRPPVPESLKAATLDPLSATFAALAMPPDTAQCRYAAQVFEGLRRTDVSLAHAGTGRTPGYRIGGLDRQDSSATCTPSGSPAMKRNISARTPSRCRRQGCGWRGTRPPASGCPRSFVSNRNSARSMRG